MIALLKGKVIAFENDSVLLDVNGVGYHLQLTGAALAQINEIGMEATLHPYASSEMIVLHYMDFLH